MKITKISMRLNPDTESVKAYASIVLDDSVKVNGIRIVSNFIGKLIVVLPENSEKKIQYVVPINREFRQYIDNALVERYFKLKSALNKIATQNNATKGNDSNGKNCN